MEDSSLVDVAASSGNGTLDQLDANTDLLLLAEVAGDALEAVEFDALRAGATLQQAVDAEQLGAALARPAGHLLVRRAVGTGTGDGLAGTVAREAAGRVGARAARLAAERLEFTPS